MTVIERLSPVRETLDAVAEDWLTAWIPDLGANFDAPLLAELAISRRPFDQAVQWLRIPQPDHAPLVVPVLHPGQHLALHLAVEPFREHIDVTLGPNVFGYRRGADVNTRYAHAWKRFSAKIVELASASEAVVIADVTKFFRSITWAKVFETLSDTHRQSELEQLSELARYWNRAGLPFLPAGYSDARMLSNAVLLPVDRDLTMPFARWIDDYRLFVKPAAGSDQAIEHLATSLARTGLQLNRSKTRAVAADDAVHEHANTLASVYHPERDPQEVVRTNLRSLLADAMEDPVGKRRTLRFTLARMQRENDEAAIGFAISALRAHPWEAPRLVSYLSQFADQPEVHEGIDLVLREAAKSRDAWLVGRVGALVLRTGATEETASAIAESLPHLVRTPAWGLALRLLAARGAAALVRRTVSDNVYDARAGLIALADIQAPFPRELASREPATVTALADGPAPLPETTSLL